MDCEANTFFGVMNAFRGLNVFSLLPLSRQEYMLMFLVFRHRKTNPEGCTVSTLTPADACAAAGSVPDAAWTGEQRLHPPGSLPGGSAQHVCDTDGCRRDRGTACQSAFGGISRGIQKRFTQEESDQLMELLRRLYMAASEELDEMKGEKQANG